MTLLESSEAYGPLDVKDLIGASHHLRPMRDTDPRDSKSSETLVDVPLVLDIQVSRALVQKEDFWLPIQRAGQQHSLFLSPESELPISPMRIL